jgi:hypothetical protein
VIAIPAVELKPEDLFITELVDLLPFTGSIIAFDRETIVGNTRNGPSVKGSFFIEENLNSRPNV